MSDLNFNDALQQYEQALVNINNSGDTNITEGNTAENTTISDLVTLINDYKDVPNNTTITRYNTYVKNNNFEGEIRFYVQDALNNNDYNKNLITGEYSGERLRFNTKIGDDGYLYVYYTFNLLDNQIKPSGWYNLIREIAQVQNSADLQNVILAGYGANLVTLNSSMVVVQGQIIEIFVALTEQGQLNTLFQQQLDCIEEAITKELLTAADSDAYNLANKGFSDVLSGYAEKQGAFTVLFDQRKIAFDLFNSSFDAIQIFLVGAGILGGAYAIYDSQLIKQKENEIRQYYKLLNGMSKNGYDTDATGVLLSQLFINTSTNDGFTTNGKYQITINHTSATTPAKIYIEVYDDLVSGTKKARILDVIYQGTGWGYGMNVSIPKTSLGGWSGTGSGANLEVLVYGAGNMKQGMAEKINKTQSEIAGLNNNIRRRQLIPNQGDFGDGIDITQTTETLASGEALPKLDIKLKINNDHFYFSSAGELLIKRILGYNFDGLSNIENINSAQAKVIDDIRIFNGSLKPTSLVIENIYTLFKERLFCIKKDRIQNFNFSATATKRYNDLIIERKFLDICKETYELFMYWRIEYLVWGQQAEDFVTNKIENLYITQNAPFGGYNPADFQQQYGLYICEDITGFGIKMMFEISAGIIVQSVVINWGNGTLVNNSIITFRMSDMGNFFEPNNQLISYSVYTGLVNTHDLMRIYNVDWIALIINKCNSRINALNDTYGILTTSTVLNPSSGLVNYSTNTVEPYTREFVTTNYLKLNVNTNHLQINASNQLEVKPSIFSSSTFFYSRDFYYNTTTQQVELSSLGGVFVNPLNSVNVKVSLSNVSLVNRQPTLYPYYDTTGRLQLSRLYNERNKQVQEIRVALVPETDANYKDTCEILDEMLIEVYKEQLQHLTYWYKLQLLKVPDANDLTLTKISSKLCVAYIQAGTNEPASYATESGSYTVVRSGATFYFTIFKGRCIDIKASSNTTLYANPINTIDIPKSSLGGAVVGQNQNLTFTFIVSNALDSIRNEIDHFKYLTNQVALRRNRRYGNAKLTDFNEVGGFKYTSLYTSTDIYTGETYDNYQLKVNLDTNDFYFNFDDDKIMLNLTNKIDGTLVYNATTRKIGINTTATQTFGNITTGTIGCGAITSSGAFSNGANTLACGAITSSGAFSNGTNTLTTGAITSTGDLFITSSRLVLRGNQPTIYLRDTDNRSGMIHMNSSIMYFLNGNGNDSETWTQQNGQNWALQLNMNNNDATFGGNVYCANLSTGGDISGGKLYAGAATGWNNSAIVAGTAASVSDGYYIFGKNNGGGGSRYCKIGFNAGFDITIGDATSTVNGAWTESFKMAYNAPASSFIINGSGNVGIGIAPLAKLHVAAGYTQTGTIFQRYFNSGTALTTATQNAVNVCAIFETSIWSKSSFISASDIRIKKNIEDIPDDLALQKILDIQPKTYNYIDVVNKGNTKIYGFIAQQINDVLPEAVSIQTETIPNIYKTCECIGNKIYIDNSGASIDTKINIIDLSGKQESYIITEVAENYIIIDKDLEGDKCFVYGFEINDHHSIDKDFIFTLNVSATKELHRKIQEQQAEIDDLKAKVNMLMTHLNLNI